MSLNAVPRWETLRARPPLSGDGSSTQLQPSRPPCAIPPDADGDGAGLAAVQNDRSYLVFGITRIAGKAMIALYTRDNADTDTLVASAPVTAADPVTLTIRADGGTMAFDYRVGGQQQTLKAGLDDSFLSTKRAGGFVGTVIGPYAWNH